MNIMEGYNMLSILQSFGDGIVGGTQREELVGYYQELKGNIDFTHMTESTNISRRFSRPLKENIKLLKDVRLDVSHLKSIALKARKITPLADSIMAESDIYRTIASLRTVERSTIAELTKIAEKTLQYESKISDNINGVGTVTAGTSNIFKQYLDASGSTGAYGGDIAGSKVQIEHNDDTQVVRTTNPQTFESVDSILPNINTVSQEPISPNAGLINDTPVQAPRPGLSIGIPTTDNSTLLEEGDFKPIGGGGEKTVGFLNYSEAIKNHSRKLLNGEQVLCLNESTKEYWVAYKYENGNLDHEHTSLPLVTTLSGASWNIDTKKAKDKIGGSYPLEVVYDTPPAIKQQWEEIIEKRERLKNK
jgi:hypothetical protein